MSRRTFLTRLSRRKYAALGLAALTITGTSAGLLTQGNAAPVDAQTPANLIVNGGFEDGLAGWRTNSPRQLLSLGTGGHTGEQHAALHTERKRTLALNDKANSVTPTVAGESYRLTAFLKSSRPGVTGVLRAREVQRSSVRLHDKSFTTTTEWTTFTVDFSTATTGGYVDVNVIGWQLPAGVTLDVDDISLHRSRSTTPSASPTPRPTTSATPRPTVTTSGTPRPTPSTSPSATPTATPTPTMSKPAGAPLLGIFNGQPNTDDTTRATFGSYPDIASTYYQGNKAINVTAEKARLAKGILPFITITTNDSGFSLGTVGSGGADAWVDSYATAIASLDATVMVGFEHEFDVKINQNHLDNPATTADFARAFNRFKARVQAKAPKAEVGLWLGGHDKVKIEEMGSRLTSFDWLSYDPYSTKSHPASETFEQTVTAKFTWLTSRSWYRGQAVYLTEFGTDLSHGDASVAAYVTNLRSRMKAIGLAGAMLFNRNRTDFDGKVVAYKIDAGSSPKSVAAFAASLRG